MAFVSSVTPHRASLLAAPVRAVENRTLRRGLAVTSSPRVIRATAFKSCR